MVDLSKRRKKISLSFFFFGEGKLSFRGRRRLSFFPSSSKEDFSRPGLFFIESPERVSSTYYDSIHGETC